MFTKNALLMSMALMLSAGMAFAGAGLDFWVQDFESDVGGATLSPSNLNSPTSTGAYWGRHDNTSNSNATFTNVSGSYWLGGADIDNASGGDPLGTATYSISIAGYTNLQFNGMFGAAQGQFEQQNSFGVEHIKVFAKIDDGANQEILSFTANGGTSGTSLFLNGTGTELTKAMAQFSANIEGTGSILTLTVSMRSSSATETAAVDHLILSGDVVPEPMTMSLLALGGVGLLRRRRA